MTLVQTMWVLLCTVGPAIYVGYAVNWWSGVIACVAHIFLGGVLGWFLVSMVPVRFLEVGGYLKNLVIAVVIVASGYYLGA